MDSGKSVALVSSLSVSSDQGVGEDMDISLWENPDEFDTGIPPYKPIEDVCNQESDEGIELIDDGVSHGLDNESGIGQSENNAYAFSPGGTRWCTPNVDELLKPAIGCICSSLDEVESLYQRYAEMAGFVIRRSSQKINNDGLIQNKYFVCSKYGLPLKKTFDSLNRLKRQREVRNSNVKRTGCTTCVKFRLLKGTTTYECYGFEEQHNHCLLRNHEIGFTRKARQMKFSHHRFVHDVGTSNMGATRAHKLHTSLRGGYESGGPTVVDYQNYKRDCDNFVGRGDAKVLVDLMSKKRESDPNFFFAYKCIDSELHTIFWADEVARFNYAEFGDVISFDSTFRTNRHYMVFVPFTAVDNHNCNVVVGSALVGHEDIPNYKWLLQAFLKAHSNPPYDGTY